MKTFNILLANSLLAGVTNNFVWFALIFWGYLETQSVLVTSVISGFFLVFTAVSGFWFGSIVDHNKKKKAMMLSSAANLAFYLIGLAVYVAAPEGSFKTVASAWLWLLIVVLMIGVIAGNVRNIAMPTLVTILIPEDGRDKANGLL